MFEVIKIERKNKVKDDIEGVFKTFKALCHAVPFKPNNFLSPYPLFSGNYVMLEPGVAGMVEVTKENYQEIVEKQSSMALEMARKSKDPIISLLLCMSTPYYMQFLHFIQDEVSPKTLGECLGHCWTEMEFPNQHSSDMLIKLFEKADKKSLMSDDEYETFQALPETVMIYRGLQSKKAKVRALSWTLSLEKAQWFASRWKQKNKVVKVLVPKRKILAYFKGRGEEEIVINPNGLTKIISVN